MNEYSANREEAKRVVQTAGLTNKLSQGEYGVLVAWITESLQKAERRGVERFLRRLQALVEEADE